MIEWNDAETFRVLGHQAIDRLSLHLKTVSSRGRHVLSWDEPEIRRRFWSDRLKEPSPSFDRLLTDLLDQSVSLHHPRYMGHQNAPALPVAALADLIVSFINSSSAIYEMGSATTMIEKAVVKWMCDHLGFSEGDGVFTSGGSLGNLTALLCARQNVVGDVWNKGYQGRRLGVLCSAFSHYSVRRACQIMGLGKNAVISVPVDSAFRMDPKALKPSLEEARRQGIEVFAAVASSGNTALGTHDPIDSLSNFCHTHGLWLHVDGAHGASACLSNKYRSLLSGIADADSVVWDAHKMLLMPALTTAVLFRRESTSYATFEQEASYLFEKTAREEWYNLSHRTLECTKRAFALRLYLCLYLHGEKIFGDYVTRQYDLARDFHSLILDHPSFDSPVVPESNIVCFRYLKEGAPVSDTLQRRLRFHTIQQGRFYLVQTLLPSGVHLRTSLMNPGTTRKDLRELLDEIAGHAQAIL